MLFPMREVGEVPDQIWFLPARYATVTKNHNIPWIGFPPMKSDSFVKKGFSGFSEHHLKELQGTVRLHRGFCDADNNKGTFLYYCTITW